MNSKQSIEEAANIYSLSWAGFKAALTLNNTSPAP